MEPRILSSRLQPGLFLERAREPDALYFAPGHTRLAGREPGLLSPFLLRIFLPNTSLPLRSLF